MPRAVIKPASGLRARAAWAALFLILAAAALASVARGEQASQPSSPVAGQIDAGGSHTCAIVDGDVYCWGLGFTGQLGYGNTSNVGDNETPGSVGPVDLGPGRTATAISAGDFHTCALLDDASVRCWGFGADGRLGYANTADIGDNETPASAGPVPTGGPAVAISAGGSHTCAVLVGGGVRCWGFGLDGRLGYANEDPVTSQSPSVGDDETPASVAPVVLGGPAAAISAGDEHTCALLVSGSVRCWGDPGNDAGGDGGDGRLGYANQVYIGDDETPSSHALFAVACPSTTQCTGVDDIGRQVTFDPAAPGTPTPTTIDANRTLNGVACPSATQCTAVDNTGRQVTFNPSAPGTPTPTTVDPNRILTAVACPTVTQCTAVDAAGQQVTFNPAAPGIPTPTTIDAGQLLNSVACPSATQCTAVGGGRQVTFNPTAPGTPTPTNIDSSPPDPNRILTAVACPSVTQCTAVDNAGRQVTFNPTAPGTPTPATIDPNRILTAVACPTLTQCTAVDNAGRQVTFNPTAPGAPTPTAVDAGRWLSAVACPSTTQCTAVGRAGQQVTFNPASPGTPTPTTIDAAAPVDVGLGRTGTAISAGDIHTCAVLDDGTVRCWGRQNPGGRLGNGTLERGVGDLETPGSRPPVDLGAGHTATAITAGNHTCALLDNRTVRCWGPGANGRLGYGNTNDIGDGATPESPGSVGPVDLGGTAAAISAGLEHTCARLDDGSLRCWGEGTHGRLGYANENDIGDNETPASAGRIDLNPGVSVGDASVTEGNSGERTLTFTVRLSAAADETVSVGYATANVTAQAPADYTARNGTLVFAPGETTKSVAVPVKGDTVDEPNERFRLNLSAGPGLTATRNATGTIVDDDAAPRTSPPPRGEDAQKAEASRLGDLRACYARVTRHARRELRRARRMRGARRTRAMRHARRHRASLRRACVRRYGRTPGRVTDLRASAGSSTAILLSFKAVGSDGTRPPAARAYVVKQSRRPIRSARAFRRAQSLCGGTCRFSSVSSIGQGLSLRVTDLRPGTRYYYAIAARDNVSRRLGPRSRAVAARTR